MIRDPIEVILRESDPLEFLENDIRLVYEQGLLKVGNRELAREGFERLVRNHTVIIVGTQFGDEGKGSVMDRELENFFEDLGLKQAYVIRYQGGSNAGHTVISPDGTKVALHQVPSSIMYPEAIGVMDSGMIIHLGSLITEIEDGEKKLGRNLSEKLVLSEEAMLATDLERAEEVFNRFLSEGASDGGTGNGISTTVARHINRLGAKVKDIIPENWSDRFSKAYDDLEAIFATFGFNLAEMDVPDLKGTRELREAGLPGRKTIKLGSKDDFLGRLAEQREWMLQRNIIKSTFELHQDIVQNLDNGILFEGSQAVGLHPQLGRYPDTTSTDTTVYGVTAGTKFYTPETIQDKIGVLKLTYMSSVGSAHMATDVGLKREAYLPEDADALSTDFQHANWIRTFAREKGTTTNRYRDICFLDLALMRYNCRISGINQLAGTHLDVAKKDVPIKVCTHYIDNFGKVIAYQPGMEHQENITPVFREFPSWDGEEAAQATNFYELPTEAQQFIAFLQQHLQLPITMVTNGPRRDQLVELEG